MRRRLRKKVKALAIAVSAFAVAVPLSLLALNYSFAGGVILFGLPLLGAAAVSYLAWQSATTRY